MTGVACVSGFGDHHLFRFSSPLPRDFADVGTCTRCEVEALVEPSGRVTSIRRASRAFDCTVESEATTIEAKRPMMAMTTSNSIRVKPCERFFIWTSLYRVRKLSTEEAVYIYKVC